MNETTDMDRRRFRITDDGSDPGAAEKDQTISSANDPVPVQFPSDVLFLILLKLPSKCIARFKCVSREFKAIIADPSFIALRRPPLVIQTMSRHINMSSPIFKYYKVSFPRVEEISLELPKAMTSDPYLIGSCHGLLCFKYLEKSTVHYVYNSLTRMWISAPPIDACGKRFCVLYHRSSTDTYHLLAYVRDTTNDFRGYMAHELGSESWTPVSDADFPYVPLNCGLSTPVATFGCVYWICTSFNEKEEEKRERVILVFDVEKEEFSTIKEPPVEVLPDISTEALTLIETDAGLGYPAFTTQTIDIWVRRGRYEPWEKIYAIDLNPLHKQLNISRKFPEFTVLLSTAGEIWFLDHYKDHRYRLTKYDCDSRTFQILDLQSLIPECYTGQFNHTPCHWESAVSLNAF